MLLAIHILLASISLLFSTLTAFVPSQKKLHISYVLIAGTLISGIALGIDENMNMAHACISGVIYLSFITIAVLTARKKIAAQI